MGKPYAFYYRHGRRFYVECGDGKNKPEKHYELTEPRAQNRVQAWKRTHKIEGETEG
jgi:hypothetical protein